MNHVIDDNLDSCALNGVNRARNDAPNAEYCAYEEEGERYEDLETDEGEIIAHNGVRCIKGQRVHGGSIGDSNDVIERLFNRRLKMSAEVER